LGVTRKNSWVKIQAGWNS